jgi:hypothetical protein
MAVLLLRDNPLTTAVDGFDGDNVCATSSTSWWYDTSPVKDLLVNEKTLHE